MHIKVDFGCKQPRYNGYNPTFYNNVMRKRKAVALLEKYDLTTREGKRIAIVELRKDGVICSLIAELVGVNLSTVTRTWKKEMMK